MDKHDRAEKPMSVSPRFWDRHAEGYSKRPVSDQKAYERKLAKTGEYLRPDMAVFEFGCGTGTTAIRHAPNVRHIVATDISAAMLEIAQRKADAAGVDNISFKQVAIDDYAPEAGAFDAVMAHSILHLVDDRDTAIAKVHEMLKPGGVFISSTPCIGESLWRHIRLVAPLGRLAGLLPLIRVFSVDALTSSLLRAGFEPDHLWRPENNPMVAFIVARKAA